MKSTYKLAYISFLFLLFSCNDKKTETPVDSPPEASMQKPEKESIEGLYETKTDENNSGDCKISLKITKEKNGYSYYLQTKTRQLRGIASFTESKEKFLVLEGIQWDDFEGDITNQEEEDSISDSEPKELEIPVGIDAVYVKDTLTIQNYGNAMNSYTKLSECDRKYIQLIKIQK